ncbi:hypothetical protein N0V83_005264 [Neocucurbitaria cava]|uniref:Uncharacterized protein n=1 Tax=Neocucurbitaria cava TaxID=798079 RepID=A0A9W8Y8M4_9PLEO|nr:hypothetical protein N0V83_005264 [Neocucurbitaria cava]
MPGSHNAERPSSSPRRGSHIKNQDEESPSYSLLCNLLTSLTVQSTTTFGMPLPDRNQYSNKESAKVNAGLEFGGGAVEGVTLEEPASFLATNTPAVDIDFSQLVVPIAAPEPKPSPEELVRRLLDPPPHAFVHDVLSMQWVRGVVGGGHFDFRESDERYVLAEESELRLRAGELGLPAVYLEWLGGDDEEVSSNEQGMYLTPEFFNEVRSEDLGAQLAPNKGGRLGPHW